MTFSEVTDLVYERVNQLSKHVYCTPVALRLFVCATVLLGVFFMIIISLETHCCCLVRMSDIASYYKIVK